MKGERELARLQRLARQGGYKIAEIRLIPQNSNGGCFPVQMFHGFAGVRIVTEDYADENVKFHVPMEPHQWVKDLQ